MTEEEKYVWDRLEYIQSEGPNDPERGHGAEDDLRGWVLQAIAHGYPDPVRLADLALRTEQMDFERWYA